MGVLNRCVLAILGLGLLAAGGGGLARGLGVFGSHLADRAVLSAADRDAISGSSWWWPGLAGGLALVALLALGWLVVVARRRPRLLRADPTGGGQEGPGHPAGELSAGTGEAGTGVPGGETLLVPESLAAVVEDDLRALREVDAARVVVTGAAASPALRVRATLVPAATPKRVLPMVDGTVLRSARQAIAPLRLPAAVELTWRRDVGRRELL